MPYLSVQYVYVLSNSLKITSSGRYWPQNHAHLLERYIIRLQHEQEHEEGHYCQEEGEEEEVGKLHVAQHGDVALGGDECEEHVDRHQDCLGCQPGLQRTDLARH